MLAEALLAVKQTVEEGAFLPVHIAADLEAAWGVAIRQEIPRAAPGLRHVELGMSQLKAAIYELLSLFQWVHAAAVCGERRQQRQMPSLFEEAREFHQDHLIN